MDNRQKIHSFALKYLGLYGNPKTSEEEVEIGFGEQCFSLGFEMDCGRKFMDAYSSEAFYKYEKLDEIIETVDDIALLGSAIFSRWRFVTHWDESSLLKNENRLWFIAAFKRLAAITC